MIKFSSLFSVVHKKLWKIIKIKSDDSCVFVRLLSSSDYKPHGSGDFFKTLSFLPWFPKQLYVLILKTNQIHAAINRWKTVVIQRGLFFYDFCINLLVTLLIELFKIYLFQFRLTLN